MILELSLVALFFGLLGTAYVKGYDLVKRHAPEHLVQFYLLMATIRMLLVATLVAIYVILADNREASIHFAVLVLIMYAIMMVITLWMRH